MKNHINITKKLLDLLEVKYSKRYLEDTLLSHPENDSLLSIVDTLKKYNIENLAITLNKDQFDSLPTPSIVQVTSEKGNLFYILKTITDNKVTYYNHYNKIITSSRKEFFEHWTGVCLIAEKSDLSKEEGIEFRASHKRTISFISLLLAMTILSGVISSLSKVNGVDSYLSNIYIYTYFIAKCTGLVISVLLIYYEFDQNNPVLQRLCSRGNKMNCDSILNSKYASLFRGNLNLSIIALSYFFATLSYVWIYGLSVTVLSFITNLSLLTIPIIFISLYYQKIILKQWCKFCVGLQIVLIIEILITVVSTYRNNSISLHILPTFFSLFLTPILAWKLIQPILLKTKLVNLYKRSLKRIKYNSLVFDELLSKSKKITHSIDGLGITFTSPNAKYNVTKICNPYCNPCAQAHLILHKLLEEGKINLQILFAVRDNLDDSSYLPTKHFLALDSEKTTLKNALNAWYSSKNKDYQEFSKKYPLSNESSDQNHKIIAMNAWCLKENITHTPTIYINGFKIPEEYNVLDVYEILR